MGGRSVRKNSGFTLVELLVVIAIISILAGLLLPALENALDSARSVSCLNQQKQMGMAIQIYVSENDDTLPPNGYYTHSFADIVAAVLHLDGYLRTEPTIAPFSGNLSSKMIYQTITGEKTNWNNLPLEVRNNSIMKCPSQPPIESGWNGRQWGDYSYNQHFGITNQRAGHLKASSNSVAVVCGGGKGYASCTRTIRYDSSLWPYALRYDTAGDYHLGGSGILLVDGHTEHLKLLPEFALADHNYVFDLQYSFGPGQYTSGAAPRAHP